MLECPLRVFYIRITKYLYALNGFQPFKCMYICTHVRTYKDTCTHTYMRRRCVLTTSIGLFIVPSNVENEWGSEIVMLVTLLYCPTKEMQPKTDVCTRSQARWKYIGTIPRRREGYTCPFTARSNSSSTA